MFVLGKLWRSFKRWTKGIFVSVIMLCCAKDWGKRILSKLEEEETAEDNIIEAIVQRRRSRERANDIIQKWLSSNQDSTRGSVSDQAVNRGSSDDRNSWEDQDSSASSLVSNEIPVVFNRASSAKHVLKSLRASGRLSQTELREVSLGHFTAKQAKEHPVADEDLLSLKSFSPDKEAVESVFDKRKMTLLERMFADDKQVRKGELRKHVKQNIINVSNDSSQNSGSLRQEANGCQRAFVIEGAALKHLLGDPELEQILFSVASNCDSVIACRVSPQQKALLVNLVRENIKPTPVTLAIGDGANDVGMIQEAHVGVGISGKEGRQAVNSSDFAISQFRFLEELVLIHGRWNFHRMCSVILFSFYKNALMVGILALYNADTVASGTSFFDWGLVSMINFVAAVPILFTGVFDRFLSKRYVRENPAVYQSSRENEVITIRSLLRWTASVIIHTIILYYFTVPQQSLGGGMTPAWYGLMSDKPKDAPGNGEGGDLLSTFFFMLPFLVLL